MKILKHAVLASIFLVLAGCGQQLNPTPLEAEPEPEVALEAGTELRAAATASIISGGYTAGGVTYAKQGDVLTLSVVTKDNAKCILFEDVTVASSPVVLGSTYDTAKEPKGGNGTDTWSYSLTAGTGNGTRSIRATPYKNTNLPKGSPTSGTSTANLCGTDRDTNDSVTTVSYRLANTPPAITGSHTPAAGTPAAQNGWYRGDVVASWSCTDNSGAGLKSPGCPAPETVTGEGRNLSRTGNVSDNVGNTNSAVAGPFNIDRTAPLTTADAPSGWQRDGVTVTLSPSDALSGVASTQYSLNNGAWTTGTSIQLGEGRHTLQWRSTDVAGNAEAAQMATVDIDLTAPTIEPSQNPVKNSAGWNSTNVTVTFTCGDSLSGVASCTASQAVAGEGTTNVRGEAVDNAGNSNVIFHPVSIDTTAPTISGELSGILGENSWYTSDVTVAFICNDAGSGIASCSGNTTLSNDGDSQSVTGNAADAAGNTNSTTVSGIKIDQTAPTTASDAPTSTQLEGVTVTFSGSDSTSGVAYTEYSLDNGTNWTRSGSVALTTEGTHNLLFRSVDNAGNVEQSNAARVTIDLSAPVVSISGPETTSDSSVTVSVSAGDSVSGVAGVTVNGQPVEADPLTGTYNASIDLTCGSNTVTAVATDGVGRTTTATHTVTRTCTVVTPPAEPVWTSQGFFAPVDMSTSTKRVLNTVKGGSTVPLKFRVYKDGVEQKDVAVIDGLKVSSMTCDASTISDAVEQVTTGSTSLRYDGTQFVQNWKTPTVLGCYRASAILRDGSAITADFKILK